MKRALMVVLVLAACGVAFSGVLVYREVFAGAAGCGAPAAGGTKILGLPACVYGFGMFLAILVSAALGLASGGTETVPAGEPESVGQPIGASR